MKRFRRLFRADWSRMDRHEYDHDRFLAALVTVSRHREPSPVRRAAILLWLLLAVIVAYAALAATARAAVPAAVAPDESYTLPVSTNTQANTIRVLDRTGEAFIIGRAESGAFKSSIIVQRMSDGTCVLCGIPDAYGTAFVVLDGGYYTVQSLAQDKRHFNVWRLDERYGFDRRATLEPEAFAPMVKVP